MNLDDNNVADVDLWEELDASTVYHMILSLLGYYRFLLEQWTWIHDDQYSDTEQLDVQKWDLQAEWIIRNVSIDLDLESDVPLSFHYPQ